MMTRIAVAFALAVATLAVAAPVRAQGSRADYERAARLGETTRLASRFAPAWHWLPDGGGVAFRRTGADGAAEIVVIDAATGERRVAATLAEVGLDEPAGGRLAPAGRRTRSRNGGGETTITFENQFDRVVRLFWLDAEGQARHYGDVPPKGTREQHTYAGHAWLADFAKDDLAGVFVAAAGGGVAVIDEASRVAAVDRGEEVVTPALPPSRRVFVRDHDVFTTGPDGVEFALSTDGTEADPYENPAHFSPDGRRVLGFQTAIAKRREIVLVESAPKDEVQPRVQRVDYVKPGDEIARPRPRLFDLEGRRQVPIDDAPFENAWSIDRVRWSEDGATVYCLYNRRGHQKLALYAIDAETGAVSTVVEETSPTFVDYSQKTWLEWLPDEKLLWASERDGWNHLYHVDAKSGAIRRITRGEWMVRRVERVDVETGQIWFTAYGIRPGEDPYHAHLARVDFDGSGLVVLTKADGTHEWTFSPDGALFVDRWSRVDHPPVTELRRANDGSLVAELGRDDASALLASGIRPPERYVAKGRDGRTDIHGIIIRPSNFDPAKRYPVIEDIYAGPHGHFVPKSWGPGLRQRTIAELGFIVVQIDGMGTNWRGKAFHDVCWRNLKDSGFPDRIAWLRAAASTRPEMDLSRVGIFGGSAGGQSALAALLHHGDFYKVAVADCGCHDNRMDKIWWNEAWMGWPIGPEYADNSNVTHAGRLNGKLLLTVGELDRNVDPASTLQVVSALVAADKDFDFLLVPGAGHGVGESPYVSRKRMDFFVRHLLGVEPPPRE